MREKISQSEAAARFKVQGLEMLEPYSGNKVPLLAKCRTDGYEWRVVPRRVFYGSGCPKCAIERIRGIRQLPQDEIVRRLRKHGFEMLEPYQHANHPTLTRCLACNHEWRFRLSHVSRRHCPKCANHLRLTQSQIVARFTTKGVELLESPLNSKMKALVRCVKCNYEWRTSSEHVFRGDGCAKCAGNARKTQSELVTMFNARGLEILTPYKGANAKVLTRCLKCNYKWEVVARTIYIGGGCLCCAEYGFQPGKSATLYYVRVSNPFGDPVYKIGITNRSVQERLHRDLAKVTIIETWHFENGAEAYEMEQDILKDYDADRWTGPDILKTGNDELFSMDVLGLDKGTGQLELVA